METIKKRKSGNFSGILTLIFYLGIGGGAGYFLAEELVSFSKSNPSFPSLLLFFLAILLIYCAFFFQVIIHEAGHLVFGLATGYQFSSFRIGKWMFIKNASKIRLKRFSISGTGGQCLLAPPPYHQGNFPWALYNLGGCIFNLMFSLIFFLCRFVWAPNIFFNIFSLFSFAVGLILAITNGIPMSTGGLYNDGKNTLSLRRSPFLRKCFWIQLAVNERLSAGVRMKHMPEEWFFVPEKEELSNCLASAVAVYTVNRAMDTSDFQKALEIGQYLLQNAVLADVHKTALSLEMFFCQMVTSPCPENLSRLESPELKKYIRSTLSYPSTIRFLYAHALLMEKDEEASKKYLVSFNAASRVYPYPSEIEGERELMEYAYQRYTFLQSASKDPEISDKASDL